MAATFVNPQLQIMGARTQNSTSYLFTRHRLVALDSATLEPVIAEWIYEGESQPVRGNSFTDIKPHKKLYVSADGYSGRIPLNVSNIDGNFFAVTARKNDGTLTSWGLASCGGTPPVNERNHDIIAIAGTNQSLCALNASGQVFSWGVQTDPGQIMAIPESISMLNDIKDIKGSQDALAALRSTGQVVAWGVGDAAIVPAEIAALTDIVDIQATSGAFAARRASGHVVAWGNIPKGGKLSAEVALLNDIEDVQSTSYAFSARRANGQIVAWGDEAHGGKVPDILASLTDVVDIAGSLQTFIARRASGHIVKWGTSSDIPLDIAALDDIVDAQMIDSAVIVLRANGQVAAWGDDSKGAKVPEGLNNVVALTTTMDSVAALKSDGRVVCWGKYTSAGMLLELKDILAVYANHESFFAIKTDNTVLVWGNPGSGGSMPNVPADVQGKISYYSPTSKLKLMGARSPMGGGFNTYPLGVKTITALDADTLQPVHVLWHYVGEETVILSDRMTDVKPEKQLQARLSDSNIMATLTNTNIVGNDSVGALDNFHHTDMSVLLDNGSVTTWGYNLPEPHTVNHLAVHLNTNEESFGMLSTEAQVYAWSSNSQPMSGYVPTSISKLKDVVAVFPGRYTFAILRQGGQVDAWGFSRYGSIIPEDIKALNDIVQIYGGGSAFAALRGTGEIVAWGDSTAGGTLPTDIAQLNDIVNVIPNYGAMTALRQNGQIVSWGNKSYGAVMPDAIKELTDIVSVTASRDSFSALRATGQVVAWGNHNIGESDVPAEISSLTDIISVSAGGQFFVALRSTGQVATWGAIARNSNSQNTYKKYISPLNDIVAVTTSYRAFSVLRANGEVVFYDEDSSSTTIQPEVKNIRAIYSTPYCFCGISDNGMLHLWPSNNSAAVAGVPPELQGNVHYEVPESANN